MKATMKIALFRWILVSALTLFDSISAQTCSAPFPAPWPKATAIQATYEGSIPVTTTEAFRYNMMVFENFPNKLYFINQLDGFIYEYITDGPNKGDTTEVFSLDTDTDGRTLAGMDFNFAFREGFVGYKQYIHSMSPGANDNEVYVVFSSGTVPNGITPLEFPPNDPNYMLEENNSIPGFLKTYYKIFVKFEIEEDTKRLINPVPFFGHAMQNTLGVHTGGAILTVPSTGDILWAVGDCLPTGSGGGAGAQEPTIHCGNLLLIDPSIPNTSEVAAVGLRNSQQMVIIPSETNDEDLLLAFVDVGGVTAEEVNAFPLATLLDTSTIENFGWGIRSGENFTREGTFYAGPEEFFQSPAPLCISPWSQTDLDGGVFIKPWIQFNRQDPAQNFGVISMVAASPSFITVQLLASEFASGILVVTDESYTEDGVVPSYQIDLLDETGQEIPEGFNGLSDLQLNVVNRVDPRLFKFPDGTAGVFFERTGEFYKLEEVSIIPENEEPPTISPIPENEEPPTVSPMGENEEPPTEPSRSECCTNNFKDCYDSQFCNFNESNCRNNCGGFWMLLDDDEDCVGRWEACDNSNDCCDGVVCLGFQICGREGDD